MSENGLEEKGARRHGVGNVLVSIARLPLDVIFLTYDSIRLGIWGVAQIPRVVVGAMPHPFAKCCSRETTLPDGGKARLCPLASKYGSLWVPRLLFPNLETISSEDGKPLILWSGQQSARRPTALGRYVGVVVLLAVLWAIPFAGVAWRYRHPLVRFVRLRPAQAAAARDDRSVQPADPTVDQALIQRDLTAARDEAVIGDREEAARKFEEVLRVDPSNLEALVGLGKTAWELRLVDKARTAFRRALEVDPWNVEALLGLAGVLKSEQAHVEAKALLEKVLEVDSDHPEARAMLSQCLLALGQVEEAQAVADAILALDPEHIEAIITKGYAQLRLGNAQSAETWFRRAIDKDADGDAQLGLARVLLATGRTTDAETALLAMMDQRPPVEEALVELVTLYTRQGHLRKAAAWCRQGLEWNPEFVAAREHLCALLMRMNRENDGYLVARELLDDDPGNVQAHVVLASMFLRKRLPALAMEHAEKALKQSSGDVRAHRIMAATWMASGDHALARDRLQGLLKLFPEDMELLLQLGYCQEQLGNLEEAENAVRKAIAAHPEQTEPLVQIGRLYVERGDLSAAEEAFRKAYELAPDHPMTQNNLASILAERGTDLEQAERLALAAKEKLPGNPVVADTLGWIRFRQNRIDDALPLLQYAVANLSHDPGAFYHYAAALAAAGRADEAAEFARRSLQLSETFIYADKARELVGE